MLKFREFRPQKIHASFHLPSLQSRCRKHLHAGDTASITVALRTSSIWNLAGNAHCTLVLPHVASLSCFFNESGKRAMTGATNAVQIAVLSRSRGLLLKTLDSVLDACFDRSLYHSAMVRSGRAQPASSWHGPAGSKAAHQRAQKCRAVECGLRDAYALLSGPHQAHHVSAGSANICPDAADGCLFLPVDSEAGLCLA